MQDYPSRRAAFQQRLREEIARSDRYGRHFVLLILEAIPASTGMPLPRKLDCGLTVVRNALRTCDVVAAVYEDTIAALMVETDRAGATAAEIRIRHRLSAECPGWRIASYVHPGQSIESLPLLAAA